MNTREHRHGSADELAAVLAQQVAATLIAGCRDRGVASLVVSGGRTPLPFFKALGAAAIDWRRVWLTLADERWVAAADAASNEKLLRDSLLSAAATAAQFVPLKNAAADAAAGASLAWQRLQSMPRPFDVVILGMGDDGHTASLFPHSAALAAALDPDAAPACVAMQAPTPPRDRLSMNLTALLQTRRLILHITGEHKWHLYQQALREAEHGAPAPRAALPISSVLGRSPVAVEVYWSPDPGASPTVRGEQP